MQIGSWTAARILIKYSLDACSASAALTALCRHEFLSATIRCMAPTVFLGKLYRHAFVLLAQLTLMFFRSRLSSWRSASKFAGSSDSRSGVCEWCPFNTATPHRHPHSFPSRQLSMSLELLSRPSGCSCMSSYSHMFGVLDSFLLKVTVRMCMRRRPQTAASTSWGLDFGFQR